MLQKVILNLLILIALFGCSTSNTQSAPPPVVSYQQEDYSKRVAKKGWAHILALLVKEGVDKKWAEEALVSSQMPEADMLTFNLNPQEKHSLYKGINTEIKRKNAFDFYLQHKDAFKSAREIYGVPEGVVLAILQVETACGKNTGNKNIFPAIARLANAGNPEIIRENLKKNPPSLEKAVYHRAAYLETTFLPHLVATFIIAPSGDVHSLKGSFAGAVGLPQFMPDNILKFGVDADKDGQINLYDADDSILSTANYLKKHGWTSFELSNAKKRAVIWEYNHSTPYIDTVLAMAGQLQKMIEGKTSSSIKKKNKVSNVSSKKSSRVPSRPAKKLRN
jgi:membrane-bound lytic murein transglycosylase B